MSALGVRSQRTWIVVVVLLAVIAGLLSWRHLRDGRSHATVGTAIAATSELDAPTTRTSLLLPDGRYLISATRPLAGVDSDAAVRTRQAPEDGSFVGLQVVRDASAAVTRWSFGDVAQRTRVAIEFTLVADGRRYPVPTFDTYGREADPDDDPSGQRFLAQRMYVAVAGRPTRLELEVDLAGHRQRVDLRTGARTTGDFASLYANRTVKQDCGTETWETGFTQGLSPKAPCTVDLVQRTPYYPAFGWAPAGRTWVVVGVTTLKPPGLEYRRAPDVLARYESYGVPKITSTLNGAAAKATGLYSDVFGPTRYDVSLFSAASESPADVLRVKATYEHVNLRTDSARTRVDTSPTVTASWRVSL